MPQAYFRFASEPGADKRRNASLERLLENSQGAVFEGEWRLHAQNTLQRAMPSRAIATGPALACATEVSFGPRVKEVCVVTPLALEPTLRGALLAHDGVVALSSAEAAEWARQLNSQFSGEGISWAAMGSRLLAGFERETRIRNDAPERYLGRELTHAGVTALNIPESADRRLLTEIEMWLFAHPMNQRRVADSKAPITAFWLWGAGRRIRELPRVETRLIGQDFVFSHWWPAGHGLEGDTLIMADWPSHRGSKQIHEPQRMNLKDPIRPRDAPSTEELFRRAVRLLRSRRIDQVHLSFGSKCYTVRRAAHWLAMREPWWDILDRFDE